ncbi:hypothetical protein NQZ68_030178 [Dissostichus eleginoides]|nr:hypothetical protein NQZ68_030178 [Dissostichus eleginoides]
MVTLNEEFYHGVLSGAEDEACSLGDLSGEEENTADHLSLSGEEGGASDPDDSAEGDSSSPPPYPALYNQGDS